MSSRTKSFFFHVANRSIRSSTSYANGRAKVADFGIASLRDDAALALAATGAIDATQPSHGGLTQTGAILGTPLYMAPELVHGARDAEPRADLWSFGVIAFELLANRLPLSEPPFLARIAGRAPAAPESFAKATLAPALAALLDRCLALEPGARVSQREAKIPRAARAAYRRGTLRWLCILVVVAGCANGSALSTWTRRAEERVMAQAGFGDEMWE